MMKQNEHEVLLRKAIDYAIEHNSFNKVNLVEWADNVCVFGLGKYFEEAFVSKGIQQKYKVNLLCDNNCEKWGKTFYDIPCISPEELLRYDNLIVIILLGNPMPVQKQLDEMGIRWITHVDLSLDEMVELPKNKSWFESEIENIEKALLLFDDEESKDIYVNGICNRIAYPLSELSWQDMYTDGEYFKQEFMPLESNESYVDCGAYNGDTVLKFIEEVRQYSAIHAFELDKENFDEMQNRLHGIENVCLYNSGVWDENKQIAYGCGSGNNEPRDGISILKAGTGNDNMASVVRLDDVLNEKKVTFIKMDIEGAEVQALKGAKEIIKSQGPKMAICVYHRTSDFWTIPKMIKDYNPNYILRLRHHHIFNCWGTVLYAFPKINMSDN